MALSTLLWLVLLIEADEMESIRRIIKKRDKCSDADVDDMFAEFKDRFNDGEDPEELLHDVFGLEPDYIFDNELGVL